MDPNKTRVSSVMSRDVVTAAPGDSLTSVMESMLSHNISHVPVVDAKRAVVGIISKTDLVGFRHLSGDTEELEAPSKSLKGGIRYPLGPGFHLELAPDVTARDVMTPVVHSISDRASLGQAAALMAAHQVHGLPVISARRGLVGFLSTLDVTSWVARS